MGVVWASPYRWQLLQIASGILSLVLGFIFLLLSIGLESTTWRIVGGIMTSFGSSMMVIGLCWCVWSVRRTRFRSPHEPNSESILHIPEWEAETLAQDDDSDRQWDADIKGSTSVSKIRYLTSSITFKCYRKLSSNLIITIIHQVRIIYITFH